MAQIVWTTEACRWLQEIYDYIAEDNEESAYRYRERPDVRVCFTATTASPISLRRSGVSRSSECFTPPSIWLDTSSRAVDTPHHLQETAPTVSCCDNAGRIGRGGAIAGIGCSQGARLGSRASVKEYAHSGPPIPNNAKTC